MPTMTSLTHPIHVDFLPAEAVRLPGRLGLTMAPGKKASGVNGTWQRDLDDDLGRLKRHYSVDALVSLLPVEEYKQLKLGLQTAQRKAKALGIDFVHVPIAEGSVPAQGDRRHFMSLVKDIVERIERCESVVLHCRGGLGRSGTVASCVLVALGLDPARAIEAVRAARTGAVQTSGQEKFVERFAELHHKAASSLLEKVMALLSEGGWRFRTIDGKPWLELDFMGEHGQYRCVMTIHEKAQRVAFYSHAPVMASEARRQAAAEYLSRANYGLLLGNFEIDFRDGEVRYKTSIDIEGTELTAPVVRNLMMPNLLMMDRYLPGLMQVLYGNASPTKAVEMAEGK